MQLWLHQPDGAVWNPPTRARIEKAARSILERQLPDGGFNIYTGGPAEVSATVKAYCALKLAGLAASSDPLRSARERILALGGLQAANSYVKINLSLFGLYPRKHVPSVPPEIVMLPGNVLYEMSSWTRSILVPLSIVQARGSNRRAPAGFTVDELLLPGVSLELPKRKPACRFCSTISTAFSRSGRSAARSAFAARPSARPNTGFSTARVSPRAWAPFTRP